MAKIISKSSNRIAKCRLCQNDIERKEMRIVISKVYVSPRNVDLHFHKNCFIQQDVIKKLLI